MDYYERGRSYLIRLPHKGDLLEELTKIAEEKNIKTGILQVIGAVSSGCVGYYDQLKREYRYQSLEEHLEIASCIGNISLLNDKPIVHAHIVFSDERGTTYGGHLSRGTIIFAGEAFIQELKGALLKRSYDEPTGLNLW